MCTGMILDRKWNFKAHYLPSFKYTICKKEKLIKHREVKYNIEYLIVYELHRNLPAVIKKST